ncbi:MAG TPA: DUF4861 family protein [Bacteroidales bacterium]|nr:DUF4861 family protein [Bacteroidales bacterium]
MAGKSNLWNFRTLSLIVPVIALFSACSANKAIVRITNPLSIDVTDAPVIIARETLSKGMQMGSFNKVPAVFLPNGQALPSQADDLDGDGNWDELFFLFDVGANTHSELSVRLVRPQRLPVFKRRSNIRFAAILNDSVFEPLTMAKRLKPEEGSAAGRFQFEGPGWENDNVGFRNYFDTRNGMDVFGKLTTEMILDGVGVNEDYHAMQHWGMDILRVGASLGAGALALERNGMLHRVAPTAAGSADVIANGPLRSILRFSFNDWEADGDTLDIVHTVSIHGGAWYYESTVVVEGAPGPQTLVSGITAIDLPEKTATETKHDGGIVSLATFGNQAYAGEGLGMAIMAKKETYLGYSWLGPQENPITNTFAVRMKACAGNPFTFRFYAVWEPSSHDFGHPGGFKKLLERDALLMAHPLKIEIEY